MRKKDEERSGTDFRLCGEYKPLNQENTVDRYPLPGIEDIFDQMGGGKICSNLDLRSGYHETPLRLEDRYKTTFWGANRSGSGWWLVAGGALRTQERTTLLLAEDRPSAAGSTIFPVLHRRHNHPVEFYGGESEATRGSLRASTGRCIRESACWLRTPSTSWGTTSQPTPWSRSKTSWQQ